MTTTPDESVPVDPSDPAGVPVGPHETNPDADEQEVPLDKDVVEPGQMPDHDTEVGA